MRFSGILNLLLLLGCSATGVFAQTLSPVVMSSFGSQSSAGNVRLSATAGQPFAAKQVAGNSVVTAGFQQSQIQVNTDSLPVAAICTLQAIAVPFKAWGYESASNVFTAQLSDANGSFTSPQTIGSMTGITSGVINATIPATLPAGSNYKIRVTSSAPHLNGRENPGLLSEGPCQTSVMELIDVDGFKCFPNPASDRIYFSAPLNGNGKIVVYDISGKAVFELLSTGTEIKVMDISALDKGIYIANYRSAELNLSTRIVKQ